jgi:hypothetical protein
MQSTNVFLSFPILALLVAGCPGTRVADKTIPGVSAEPMTVAPPAAGTSIGELRGPESVLYDREQDVYFISNMNGGLTTVDGNGFISRVDARSLATNLHWIESGRNGVRLDSPKGMAIVGDTLYVSDITVVRTFDRRTGAPRATIPLPGATLINDLTTDGTVVYASDTGIVPGAGVTFASTGTDAIWKIENGAARKIASGSALGHPNGLDFVNGELRVVTFHGDELYELHAAEPEVLSRLPLGQLDGLVHLENGDVLVSSWKGNAVYRGPPGGPFRAILKGIDAPADIAYDATHHRLLVPAANQVTIHTLR